MYWLPASLLLAVGTPPAEMPDTLVIADVWERRDQLDGKQIRVTGTLRSCNYWTCILAERSGSDAKYLSIGHAADYDWQGDPLNRHRVVVVGKFRSACLPENDDPGQAKIIVACTDAARTLLDTRIVSAR